MSKFRMMLFAVVGILMSATVALAQAEAATGPGDNASSVSKYRALAAGIGFGIAVIGGALGQSRIFSVWKRRCLKLPRPIREFNSNLNRFLAARTRPIGSERSL